MSKIYSGLQGNYGGSIIYEYFYIGTQNKLGRFLTENWTKKRNNMYLNVFEYVVRGTRRRI